MKIYLAHSLTQAPEEFKQEMLEFREKLKTQYEILEYLGLDKGTAEDVFRHDVNCVHDCGLLLAEVSYPAIGLGFEIATALQLNKKVLAVAKETAKVSRLVLGIEHPNFQFARYTNLDEIFKHIPHD
ncbi:MAG: nucleoside 2-deoxyribosyltransferase [Patescibacteria group bacterium]|nr:nucleoside 2-deoxyribosyltransferase [Patescibacteria group bacterium]